MKIRIVDAYLEIQGTEAEQAAVIGELMKLIPAPAPAADHLTPSNEAIEAKLEAKPKRIYRRRGTVDRPPKAPKPRPPILSKSSTPRKVKRQRAYKLPEPQPLPKRIPPALDSYPASLHYPTAEVQRTVYDALKDGPKQSYEVREWIAQETRLETSDQSVSQALFQLKQKALARKDDAHNGAWMLTPTGIKP